MSIMCSETAPSTMHKAIYIHQAFSSRQAYMVNAQISLIGICKPHHHY